MILKNRANGLLFNSTNSMVFIVKYMFWGKAGKGKCFLKLVLSENQEIW